MPIYVLRGPILTDSRIAANTPETSQPLNRRDFLAGLAALGIAVLAGAGCHSSVGGNATTGSSATAGKASGAGSSQPGVLRYPMITEPTSFDPAQIQDTYTADLVQNIYEGLVGWNETGDVIPLAAKELPKLSADGKTYTFTLRDNLKFHNGRAVTADDVRYSLVRALDPRAASPVAPSYLNDIVGATEFNTGKATDVAGIKVIDAKTIAITIKEPRAYFLGKFTYPTGFILAKEAVEKGEKNSRGFAAISADNVVGTGPFKLTKYAHQETVILEANADYWAGKPKLARIERPIVLDPKTARNLYDSGEVDFILEPRNDYQADRNVPDLKAQIKTYPRAGTWYVGLNQGQYPPFKDKRVRQAIALAIDKKSIVDNVLLGVNDVAESFVPAGVFSNDPSYKGLGHDTEKAKKLLADAGFPGGAGLPQLTMSFREQDSDIRKACEVIKEQLSAVGIALNLQEMEWAAFLKQETANKGLAFYNAWSADYLDPQDFISLFFTTNGTENHTGYSNPRIDAICKQADAESDKAKRTTLYQQADHIAMEDATMIPIFYHKDMELTKPYVSGVRDSLFGHLPHTMTTVS